jgi:hypothetical protein
MSDPCWRIRKTDSGLEVALHVQPRARRTEIDGLHNGALKLKVTAPPVEDAANRAVIEFFASLLDVPKSRLQIVSGLKSREKVLRIESVSLSDFSRHFPSL